MNSFALQDLGSAQGDRVDRHLVESAMEAADRLDDEEFRVIEQVIEGVLLKHEVKRLTASA